MLVSCAIFISFRSSLKATLLIESILLLLLLCQFFIIKMVYLQRCGCQQNRGKHRFLFALHLTKSMNKKRLKLITIIHTHAILHYKIITTPILYIKQSPFSKRKSNNTTHLMKRAKLKLHNLQSQKQQCCQMSPWSKDHQMSESKSNQIERIPTQRLEIVQKFFSNLQTKNKKLSATLKNGQQRKINRNKSIDNNNNHSLNNSLNNSIEKFQYTLNNLSTINKDQDQQLQIVKMFKKHREQYNKSRLKTTVINLDAEFKNQYENKYGNNRSMDKGGAGTGTGTGAGGRAEGRAGGRSVTLPSQEDNKKTFTRKLRIKQQLANKKNIERVYSRNKGKNSKQPRSYSCMSKNAFYLFELGNIGTVKTGNYQSMYPAAHRRKTLQLKNSRPNSQVLLRPKSHLY